MLFDCKKNSSVTLLSNTLKGEFLPCGVKLGTGFPIGDIDPVPESPILQGFAETVLDGFLKNPSIGVVLGILLLL